VSARRDRRIVAFARRAGHDSTRVRTHHVYLIPGFFGFASLGDVLYFRRVRETLERDIAARGDRAVVHSVRTYPTGSLKRRAGALLRAIGDGRALEEADAIHLVGHSTGGIDARLVASTARDLGSDDLRAALDGKLRTVVCIAAPHYGTPLANFFTTLYGKKLLYLMTLLVFVGLWRRPVMAAAGLLGLGYRIYDLLGLREDMLRQVTNQLLRDFTPEREREVKAYLESVLGDVSLMVQLTPEAMEPLNAAIEPRPGVRIVSYGAVSPPPMKTLQRTSLRDLLTPLGSLLYGTLYTLTSSPEPGYAYHPPFSAKNLETKRPLTFPLDASSCDGIVPSLSQVYGEFRGFVGADHLDVVGHYLRGPDEAQDGADWFVSGARFDRTRFDVLWGDVADVVVGRD
jgi:triacylglycerol lipase